MGNVWTSNRRDYSKHWTPHGEEFSRSERKKSKRWSLRKPRGYYKTVSDLDVERGIPLYLHYQGPNSIEEDLFTMDSRAPCVIHLHQRTRQDLNHLLRGSEAYTKGPRPRSLDPRLLMDDSAAYDDLDPYLPRSPRNSSFMSSSAHINHRVKHEHEQQKEVSNLTPDRNMKIDSSSANIDIIKVDTSGAKFERQANLRRSQRLSSCSAVRQRANASQRRQLRHKHKTLTGLPGNISSELNGSAVRPHSLHSDANNSSFVEGGSSDESRSYINGHVVSPNQRNAEIQTDDVKVIPITPAQRRMKQKGIKSNHASPASSHGSTEFLDSPTKVPCPSVPNMKQNSTPVNGHADREMIRPTSLDVKNNDTSTDEGRHTGESNPPTPVRNGTPNELSTSPNVKKSPSSPMTTSQPSGNGNHNNNDKPSNIALRINGARLQQGEDRASSGCWSGTESVQHSSSSDITMQHAPVMNALQHMLKKDHKPHSPVYANSVGQISPIVNSRPLVSTSAVDSSSSISINSKLSTLDLGTSTSSLCDDDRFQSASSSVISVTLNRSNNNSTLSLNSSEGGTAVSAKAMLKKSRKSRLNATGGSYNFMNYEADPLEPTAVEIPRTVKNRRSTRSMKNRGLSKKRHTAEDTISVSSMADSSPQNTDPDAHSVHSGGQLTNDTASLCDSMFSVDQEGYYTSMHDDCGLSKSATQYTTSVTSMPGSVSPDVRSLTPVEAHPTVFEEGGPNMPGDEIRNNSYNSYNRAVKSNHSTPKSLLTSRVKSASVKSADRPASDFKSELNKRLSVRRSPVGTKSPLAKKNKRGSPPPPPKRESSLSSSSSPSPSSSMKSLSEHDASPAVSSPLAVSPGIATPQTPHKVLQSPEEFYKTTPPPPPPMDQLPPPPPELLDFEVATSPNSRPDPSSFPPPPPVPVAPVVSSPSSPPSQAKSPTIVKSPRSPISEDPLHSIAMQAALLGSKRSQKKKNTEKNQADAGSVEIPKSPKSGKSLSQEVAGGSAKSASLSQAANAAAPHAVTKKIFPPTTPKTTHVLPTPPPATKKIASANMDKIPPPTGPKTTHVAPPTSKPNEVVKTPPLTMPKTMSFAKVVADTSGEPNVTPAVKIPPPVASKPVNPPEEFTSKKTREQSPSYRASVARAAFFASVSSPGPETAPKPGKVPQFVPTLKQEKDKKSQSPTAASKTATETQISEVSTEKVDSLEQISEKAQTALDVASDSTPPEDHPKPVENEESESSDKPEKPSEEVAQNEPDWEAQPQDNWLEEIEQISSPTRRDSSPSTSAESDSAAARLGLASTKQSRYPTHDNLMAAIHKSKREALSGKQSSSSPPSSPGTNGESFSFRANGNKSPGSTLERKRNGRLSSNGHRNAMSRRSTGGTSRDDFKALLLQNACRGTSGSQMSAAEKLLLNKPQGSAAAALSRQRPMSMTDAERKVVEEKLPLDGGENTENSRSMFSLNDIRSAITSGSATTSRIGRSNRRGQRPIAMEPKYATMSVHGKKHPPQSLSSKYNSRSRTPTRPMMSIDEDSETEKSPEQPRIQSKLAER